jgi:hypothetical protein
MLMYLPCPCPPGFVPQAPFIFTKNCSQVWAEALNDFTQRHGNQRSEELPEEAKGDQGLEAEKTELKQEVE